MAKAKKKQLRHYVLGLTPSVEAADELLEIDSEVPEGRFDPDEKYCPLARVFGIGYMNFLDVQRVQVGAPREAGEVVAELASKWLRGCDRQERLAGEIWELASSSTSPWSDVLDRL